MMDSFSLDALNLSGFTFREACPDDAKQISVVEKNAQPAPWDEIVFKNEFDVKVSNIWVCSNEENTIVAFIVFWIVVDEVHILNVAVHDVARRRGIASAFIKQLKSESERTKKTVLSLEVRASNVPAQALYDGLGFKKIARRKGYYSDNNEDAIILACVIEEPCAAENS